MSIKAMKFGLDPVEVGKKIDEVMVELEKIISTAFSHPNPYKFITDQLFSKFGQKKSKKYLEHSADLTKAVREEEVQERLKALLAAPGGKDLICLEIATVAVRDETEFQREQFLANYKLEDGTPLVDVTINENGSFDMLFENGKKFMGCRLKSVESLPQEGEVVTKMDVTLEEL